VFIGIGLVSKEVERRSIYSLLSKPIHRYQLVLGKYAGLVLTLAVNIAIMVAAFYLVLAYMKWMAPEAMLEALDGPAMDPRMLKAVVLTFAQLSIVTAIALFFSTFSSPMLSATFTLGIYVAGHFSADLKNFGAVVDSPAAVSVARGLYWVLPNLAPFDVKSQVVHAQAVPWPYLMLTLAYGAVYVGVLLTMAVMIFTRRDFK
jgi:ABC-type transport system involved in multi-copper enzyme maturation permease subunit